MSNLTTSPYQSFFEDYSALSAWSSSPLKRLFDIFCVLLFLPAVVPMLAVCAAVVWLSSDGPVVFCQKRMGRYGQTFTIFKFRTLVHHKSDEHHPVTTVANQRFTPPGRVLRRFKLDELPQVINVLLGDMSLVGPRPKLPVHQLSTLPCRPGITGASTLMFAREEKLLAQIPVEHLSAYNRHVILPLKERTDGEYMAQATFVSDFGLIVSSVLRRWDDHVIDSLPHDITTFTMQIETEEVVHS